MGLPVDSLGNDETFRILRLAKHDEISALGKILEPNEKHPSVRPYELMEKLCYAGGHSVNNAFRGCGVPYPEIVLDVYRKLKIGKPTYIYRVDEKRIVEHIFDKVVSSLNEEQRREFEKAIQEVAKKHGVSMKGLTISSGSIAAAGAAGFAPYLMATSALSAITGAFGLTLPFAAYTTLTSTMGVLLGPVGWAGIGAYGVYTLGKPNFKKTIPAVALVHSIRSRLEYEENQKSAS